MPRVIRLGIADRHELFRVALAHLLSAQEGLEVVGETTDAAATIRLVQDQVPDVLLMDPDLAPGTGVTAGLEAVREVRRLRPATEIVILTDHEVEDTQRRAFEAGIRAYLLKDCSLRHVQAAIQAASQGEFYLAGRSGEEMVAEYVRPLAGRQGPGGLITPRERELACLLADGYSSKEAAGVLSISVKTVETHRASLMKKLGARNVVDIVKYCLRNRLIELD